MTPLLAIALTGLGMIWLTCGEARVAPALFVQGVVISAFVNLLS